LEESRTALEQRGEPGRQDGEVVARCVVLRLMGVRREKKEGGRQESRAAAIEDSGWKSDVEREREKGAGC